MERARPVPVIVLCLVTLVIWVNRIWLAWTDDELTVAEKVLWSLPIVAFVAIAVVLLAMMLFRGIASGVTFVRLVQVFAAGTILYWAIRLPMILLNDHPSGFKVVHTVLALGSMASAAWAWRAVADPRLLEPAR